MGGARTSTTIVLLGLLLWGARAVSPEPVAQPSAEPPTVVATAEAGVLVVDLVDGAGEEAREALSSKLGSTLNWLHPETMDEALAIAQVPDLEAAVNMLASDPRVEVVEPEVQVALPSLGIDVREAPAAPEGRFPNDPLYPKQWHLDAMGAPHGWAYTPRGAGIIVAVLDTGVAAGPDLEDHRVFDGVSFVTGEPTARDRNGHGTHVAGTIAQSTNNQLGTAGVAPGASILPVKVLSRFGAGNSAWIAAGIDYAADQGADVINLSLGGAYSRVVHTAVVKARRRGVVVIAAAGNSGRRGVSWPGALDEAIGVAAVGPSDQPAPYSSWGPGVDIAAPGGDKRASGGGVLQETIAGEGFAFKEFQGTSMAAPHVSGAAAILLSTGSCDASCVEQRLLSSARGDGVSERVGHGLLDLQSALSSHRTRRGWTGFALGGVFAWAMASLARGGRRFAWWAALAGAASAGGLFFLPHPWWLGRLGHCLAEPFLYWPNVLLGPGWAYGPLWLSAAVPLMVAFVLGAGRSTRPLALGFCAGVGAHLLWGGVTGSLLPSWLPASWGALWVIGHGTICVVLGLSLAGAEKLDRGREH